MEFVTYSKIHAVGHKDVATIFEDPTDTIVMQEKVDGAQFRFMIHERIIVFGSHHRNLGDNHNGDSEAFTNKFWLRCVGFINDKLKTINLEAFEGWIFYGECMVKHSIDYDWATMPPFVGYDILTPQGWVGYPQNKLIFEMLGLPFINTLGVKTIQEVTDLFIGHNDDYDVLIPQSAYYSGQMEGIVFKNYAKNLYAKLVAAKFKEVNKDHFGHTRKEAKNDNELFVATYCTNARIDKQIFDLVAQGQSLEMSLMAQLPKIVYEDIWTEQWQEISASRWAVDFQQLRKLVGQRCKVVLMDVITRNQFQRSVGEINDGK